jgi:hypothetical protein
LPLIEDIDSAIVPDCPDIVNEPAGLWAPDLRVLEPDLDMWFV